jgi:YggT family protein
MHALLHVILLALSLYMWCLIGMAIMSWLLAFNVLNRGNPTVYRVFAFLERITEPALTPIRRVIPPIGGIDISPVILILLITFLQQLIVDNMPGSVVLVQ